MNDDSATIEIADWTKLPSDPKVSVYMLAFRHEKFIVEAIEGVIAQQCDFPIELIIGEDCSPDSTGTIVRDYQDRYPHLIRILTAKRNVGTHANTFRCRKACRGQFVAICEGDDYWHHPGKLQLQHDYLEMYSCIHLVHTDYDRQIGKRILRDVNARHPPEYLARGDAFMMLLFQMTVMTATAMYRHKLLVDFECSGITPTKWPFGDYPIALYASLRGPVGYIPRSTAVYRYVRGSIMNQGYSQALLMQKAGLDCQRTFMDFCHLPDEQRLAVECVSHKRIMQSAALAGDSATCRAAIQWIAIHELARAESTQTRLLMLAEHSALRIPYLFLLRFWHRLKFYLRSEAVQMTRGLL